MNLVFLLESATNSLWLWLFMEAQQISYSNPELAKYLGGVGGMGCPGAASDPKGRKELEPFLERVDATFGGSP